MAVRKKREEKLSETNINKVIDLLAAEKPITKKEACEILHIAYNTTRLSKIIADHNETLDHRARRKAQNKGKGVTEVEKQSIVKYYLEGSNVSDIAKALYRSPAFIKAVIERMGVPTSRHRLQRHPRSYDTRIVRSRRIRRRRASVVGSRQLYCSCKTRSNKVS